MDLISEPDDYTCVVIHTGCGDYRAITRSDRAAHALGCGDARWFDANANSLDTKPRTWAAWCDLAYAVHALGPQLTA